eukprot:scaffold25.g5127.t1
MQNLVPAEELGEGENDYYSYGVASMQGWRTDQEDAHASVLEVNDPKTAIFAIFDGHGGREVSKFCAAHLPQELSQADGFANGDVERALAETFLRMDELLVKDEYRDELKQMRGSDSDEEKDAPMVINGASLPDSLLEALGLQAGSGSGFQIKLVRSGPGGKNISIDDIEAEEDQEGGEEVEDAKAAGAEEAATVRSAKPGAEAERRGEADDSDRASKRKREGMQGEDEYGGPCAGCTAVCAVVRGNELYVANAGDSRCVLCRNGTALAMSTDHKPTDAEEYDRIIKAGGFVADGRVNGSLNLSRAIGDLEYKQTKASHACVLGSEVGPGEQMVTAMPEVRKEALQPGDAFLILACDGIWDVLTNQEAVDFVVERLAAGKSPKAICEEICDHCLAPDTGGCGKGCDNMSVQVVLLKPFAHDLLQKGGAAGGHAAAAEAAAA